eukprot:2473497-Rhodomonas_salina.2
MILYAVSCAAANSGTAVRTRSVLLIPYVVQPSALRQYCSRPSGCVGVKGRYSYHLQRGSGTKSYTDSGIMIPPMSVRASSGKQTHLYRHRSI